MKAYWGSEGITPRILTSALDGGEWSASRPGRFTSGEATTDAHWMGGCLDNRAGLDAVVRKKFPAPTGTRTNVITLKNVVTKSDALRTVTPLRCEFPLHSAYTE
jgi:hypothetical protein